MKDVSFTVEQGEVLGIIGRNGAGKSTLLKILSRVTAPTEGRIRVKGRVASLLEVGTGFHPDLTGRENIYTSTRLSASLNGAILGMSRREIDRKFDETCTERSPDWRSRVEGLSKYRGLCRGREIHRYPRLQSGIIERVSPSL